MYRKQNKTNKYIGYTYSWTNPDYYKTRIMDQGSLNNLVDKYCLYICILFLIFFGIMYILFHP